MASLEVSYLPHFGPICSLTWRRNYYGDDRRPCIYRGQNFRSQPVCPRCGSCYGVNSSHNRSLVLSISLGSVLAGAAIGPRVSVVFYALTSINKALATFTIAAACHAVYAVYVLFMLPESLSRPEMKAVRQKYSATLQSSEGCLKRALKRLNLANPLALLGPKSSSTTPRWSLTLLAISYAVGFMLMDVSTAFKIRSIQLLTRIP